MREINWSLFKAKFDGKERYSFENLAYHLFCAEHGNRIGIFRFKNQTGLETEPINVNDEIIGFQSKYYETKISDNTEDIIDSIQKAKRENASLNKILFYINQEFSESSTKGTKDPKYKKDIEDVATKLNVEIEWRVPSHFEIQLSLPDNQYLLDFYYSNEKSIIDFINELKSHTSFLLNTIHNDIKFRDTVIKIDRHDIVQNIKNNILSKKSVIISGEGGIGKTAIIKELYSFIKKDIPVYFFKAIEFNCENINDLLHKYGNFKLSEFLNAHDQESIKIVIIDSAERILDLDNQEPIKEFLAALVYNSWQVIFTTRNSYLNDLSFQLLNVYRSSYENVVINKMKANELYDLSILHSFSLPANEKLTAFICNPFYLNEYLNHYSVSKDFVNTEQLKDILWNKKIQNSEHTKGNTHLEREKCFLEIIKKRSQQLSFYIHPINCKPETINLLVKDEIISSNDSTGGYFINHDIFEEWGFDKMIERSFNNTGDIDTFLNDIGTSLVVRRAFRLWLSYKLDNSLDAVKPYIEKAIEDGIKDEYWKNEFIISIMLSEYSEEFFIRFKVDILQNDALVLKKITFVLRTYCKSINVKFSSGLYDPLNNDYLFTNPLGAGWNNSIKFIHDNLNVFSISDLQFIIPIVSEWVNSNDSGSTTRFCGLIALHFCENHYKKLDFDTVFYQEQYNGEELLKIILQSSKEISSELSLLIKHALTSKSLEKNSFLYKLSLKTISSDFYNQNFLLALPDQFIEIAKLVWFENEEEKFSYSVSGIEEYFGLNSHIHKSYYPASAFQTPLFRFLKIFPIKAIDLIIDVTNSAVNNFIESNFENKPNEVYLILNNGKTHRQYISNGLWNMYRGSGAPVTPYLLQSIHMALEKYLLEIAKEKDESKIVESLLIYLIEKSISASISAVVTSIVLSHPDKYFNVAKILFSCIDFIRHDSDRATFGESGAKSLYTIGFDLGYKNKLFKTERIKTCDDSHRSNSLENQILNYQFFRSSEIDESIAENRQQEIWTIIDNHYLKIPEIAIQTLEDKYLRFLLTKIDRRKMVPLLDKIDGDKVAINLTPQLDDDLIVLKTEQIKNSVNESKYRALFLWAHSKYEGNDDHLSYPQYNNNYDQIISDTKELILFLENGTLPYLIHFYSTPSIVCSVLIKEVSSQLTPENKNYCKEIILNLASEPLKQNYEYQISDGVEPAVNTLPFLIVTHPEEKQKFMSVLTLLLFNTFWIGQYKRICDYSIESIHENLWKSEPNAAFNILKTFIKYKPFFNKVLSDHKSTIYNNSMPGYSLSDVYSRFKISYGDELNEYFSNEVLNLEEYDFNVLPLEDLDTILQLIPYDSVDPELTNLILKISSILSVSLLKDNNKIDPVLQNRVFKKLTYFILFREEKEVPKYIAPFVSNFIISKGMSSFFQEFISTENSVAKYDQFWVVWNEFYEKIKNCTTYSDYRYSELIQNYLLAWPYWPESAKSWHSMKDREKVFFAKVVNDIGHIPRVIDAIAQFLNQIGSEFINEGIFWVSDIMSKNTSLTINNNSLIYIERLARKYIFLNRNLVRSDIRIKSRILIILDFLVERSSINAFLLREDIL